MADPTSPEGLVGDPAAVTGTMGTLTGNTPAGTFIGTGSSVASNADYVGETNVTKEAELLLADPKEYLGKDGNLSSQVPTIDPNTQGTNIDANQYTGDADALQGTTSTVSTAQSSQVTAPTSAVTFDAATVSDQAFKVADNARAATAQVTDNSLVNVDTFDMQGLATGINQDGSANAVGQSFNKSYTQNISTVVDTSTVSGKLLAQNLGEGNYTDAKATVTGQLEILSKDFVDPVTGQPTIPPYAAGALKGVERMLAFKGVTGTAALSAVAAATMESILPIAQAEAQFFQTLTVKNLDAKNTQAINTANILSKMNVADLDTRMTQAVNNAKTFMQYDLTNVANEQQVEIVKQQAKQQAILEDGKQENVQRQFNATEQNTLNKFYDQLGAQIDQFNVEQRNTMEKFNSGELNDMTQFNLSMENQREQFYKEMQFQVDAANAKWRQTVTLTENQQLFEAAATDVKNYVGLTSESMNRMWDRTDALLDYSWKESESEKDRRTQVQIAKMNYDAQVAAANAKKTSPLGAIGSIAGSVIGQYAGSQAGSAAISSIFTSAGPAAVAVSDERLKENIEPYGVTKDGIELFTYDWTDEARRMGIKTAKGMGPIAQRVQKTHPHAVIEGKDGYLRVDYGKILKAGNHAV